jgi:hypothetical protein
VVFLITFDFHPKMKNIIIIFCLLALMNLSFAQTKMKTPLGESIVSTIEFTAQNGRDVRLVATLTKLYMCDKKAADTVFSDFKEIQVDENSGNILELRRTQRGWEIAVVFERIIFYYEGGTNLTGIAGRFDVYQDLANEKLRQSSGNGKHVITNKLPYKINDNINKKFVPDTVGLPKISIPVGIASNSINQTHYCDKIYCFKKDSNSTSWSKTSYMGPGSYYLFSDRQNRLWVPDSLGFAMSENKGGNYNYGSKGDVVNLKNIRFMDDDTIGNVYAVTGNNVYKSVGGFSPFLAFDSGVLPEIKGQVTTSTIRSVSSKDGNNILYGTEHGLFVFVKGNKWLRRELNKNVPSENILGLAKAKNNAIITSTNLGTFIQKKGDTAWQKTLPAAGVMQGAEIFSTQSGNLYTTSHNNKLIWKSTDNGNNWGLDTAGFSNINSQKIYIDSQENMHAFVKGNPAKMYVKNFGGSWQPDMAGLVSADTSLCTLILKVRNVLYLGREQTKLQKRAASGGNWTTDTMGLGRDFTPIGIAEDGLGNLWAVPKRGKPAVKPAGGGGSWKRDLLTGSGIDDSTKFNAITLGPKGSIIATALPYKNYGDQNYMYKFKQSGAWIQAEFMDSIKGSVHKLIPIGDTLYALTRHQGIRMFSNTVLSVKKPVKPNKSSDIIIYPNPTSNSITISSAQALGEVTIMNYSGLILWTNNLSTASISINMQGFSSGFYFIVCRNDKITSVQKIIKD